VQAPGGKLDLIAGFGDHTLTVTTTEAPTDDPVPPGCQRLALPTPSSG
jgi:hypothetical protein